MVMTDGMLTIGEVARRAGLRPSALRYSSAGHHKGTVVITLPHNTSQPT